MVPAPVPRLWVVGRAFDVVDTQLFTGALPKPIETLERHFLEGGMSLIQAVFENSFFASPDSVRARTPYFPEFARRSREHYPGLEHGSAAQWQGAAVKLDVNARAQMAWAKYSGRPIQRGSGYGVRHVWGNPWNPVGYTAGWNLVYMPFWAGMLTEDQHPHPGVQLAIKQASWDLYFRDEPVCDVPDFVRDPGADLATLLDGQSLLILEPGPTAASPTGPSKRDAEVRAVAGDAAAIVKVIRTQSRASWSNLNKAVRALQDLDHAPFGTKNVENTSKSHVRRMQRETDLSLRADGAA